MIPTYELTGETYEIADRGLRVYVAKLTCDCTRANLRLLIGDQIGDAVIVGVESVAIESQNHRLVGLAVAA